MQLDVRLSRMLLADWFQRLGREAGMPLVQYGSSDRTYTLGSPNAFVVTARFTDSPPYLLFTGNDDSVADLAAKIAADAADRATRGDMGGTVWYSGEFHESKLGLSPFSFLGDLFQRLGSQTRITGWRRLSESVLLEFSDRQSETGIPDILAPRAIVRFHIAATGPCQGFLTSEVTHGTVEIVGAICAFALGRPIEIPHTIFLTRHDALAELDRQQRDPQILTLARKGIGLDIMSYLGTEIK